MIDKILARTRTRKERGIAPGGIHMAGISGVILAKPLDSLGSIVLPCFGMTKATYDLHCVKGLMQDGSWRLTESARDTATELGFDDDDVFDCVVNYLEETHFYKTMEATARPGLMQDVYHITYQSVRLYVKLQISVEAVVISFKEKD